MDCRREQEFNYDQLARRRGGGAAAAAATSGLGLGLRLSGRLTTPTTFGWNSCKTCHLFATAQKLPLICVALLFSVAILIEPSLAMSFFSSAAAEPSSRAPTGGAANLDFGDLGSLGFNVDANGSAKQFGSTGGPSTGLQANFNANLNGLGGGGGGGGAASGSGQFDLSNLISLGLAANPAFALTKAVLPQTYQGISADLNNGLSMVTNGAGQQFESMQSSLQNSMDGTVDRLKRFQQNLANRFVDNEEMMLRLYEMALNPERMCRQLASQTQKGYQKASQQAQSGFSNANQQLNGLMSSANNQFNSAMNTTPNEALQQAVSQTQPATQQVQSLIKRFGFGKK